MLTYPAHQAADILFCAANVVPVGLDQLPHLETTRAIARRFNDRYSPLFPEPQALLSDTPMLHGLDGRQMSRSRGNSIALADTAEGAAHAIRRAPTDSEHRITYEPERRPGVAALLELYAATCATHPHTLAERIGTAGAGRLN